MIPWFSCSHQFCVQNSCWCCSRRALLAAAVTVTCRAAELSDGCLEKTRILQHSWQLLALVLIQSLGLLCCIHLNQNATGMNPSGCIGGSRVAHAKGWEDSTFAAAAGGSSPSSGAELIPLRHLPALILLNHLPAGRRLLGFSCCSLVLPHPAEARVNHSCVGTAPGAGFSLREALQ